MSIFLVASPKTYKNSSLFGLADLSVALKRYFTYHLLGRFDSATNVGWTFHSNFDDAFLLYSFLPLLRFDHFTHLLLVIL